MENETNKSSRIHPLVGAAAASVVLVSLVGVAAITGILPTSHGTNSPVVETAKAPTAAEIANANALEAQKQAEITAANAKRAQTDAANARLAAEAATREERNRNSPQPRASTARYDQYEKPVAVARAPAVCNACGRVESVRAVETRQQPSGLGIAAGAIVGGLLGNQVGGGNGRSVATVAGAVGGGFAGNEVEKRTRTAQTYEVRVRMENGTIRNFPYNHAPEWNSGDQVRVVDGYLTRRG
ncbi:MAG: glycine zipper 2TM domain-containing protein [Janthinobacterium lividum]